MATRGRNGRTFAASRAHPRRGWRPERARKVRKSGHSEACAAGTLLALGRKQPADSRREDRTGREGGPMSPNLIVVSNREPYLIRRTAQGQVVAQPSPGGLVSALDPTVRALGGVWI